MEELLRAVGNFGFPMVISAYLLIRVEGKLEQLAAAVGELAAARRVHGKTGSKIRTIVTTAHTGDRVI